MKIFSRLFQSKKKRDNVKGGRVVEAPSATTSADNSTKSLSETALSSREQPSSKKSPSKSKNQSETKSSSNNARTKPAKVQLAEAFMAIAGRHDPEELLAAFSSPKSRIHLEDGFSMDAKTFCGALKHMWDAFPDHKFRFESIHMESSSADCNKVLVEGLVSSATHTGVPYTLGEKYPAIEAFGKHVINDEERFVFTFADDGKLKSMAVISFGNVTGPAGFYEQIGGNLAQ